MIIAVANSRKEKKWKNIEISWSDFLKRAGNTIRTAESVNEYRKLSKPMQDETKDVGGFVGGKLKDGKRKKGFIEYRSMLTLDMDYAEQDIWDRITMLFDFACCIYSTHKHTEEKPRLRLIIPLSRNISEDEYIATGRLLASDIGIEQFDDTTYEPSRLMYWPSTSSDGEFIFEKQEALLLNPDKILSRYKDWKDSSKWPVSSRQNTIIRKNISKQADPFEKKGIIGAFCRTYSITGSIEKFLKDIYKPSFINGRYDYIPADSTAGVLIYDDKFSYSHHATDPACGRLLNAFDLVRVHKFGDLDGKTDEDTIPSKLPSFKAMQEFSLSDESVKVQLAKERTESVKMEFEETIDEENWQVNLELNKDGTIKDTPTNILMIIKYDNNLKAISYNLMSHILDVKGILPWRQIKSGWNDSDFSNLKLYMDKNYGIWSPLKIKDALVTAATERGFHPIKEYLEKLPEWDGVKRIDTLLIDYLGAEDNSYNRAVMRKTLVAAVARIYEPGIKFDHIIVLNGKQGIGKSTLFSRLGGRWFSDSLTISDMRDKSAAEKLQGYWILELGELAGIRKMEVEVVKSFISRTDDKFRQSYGVNVESHPRQCIIVGTTNSTGGFLRDITGNRRFWPVRVDGSSVKKPWQISDVRQVWSEALMYYRTGEDLVLKKDDAEMAYKEQKEAMETDDREGIVVEYLDKLLPENWSSMELYQRRSFLGGGDFESSDLQGTVQRDRVCIMEIWCECFGKDRPNIKKSDSYEIEAILNKLGGWKRYDGNTTGKTRIPGYGIQRTFVRCDIK